MAPRSPTLTSRGKSRPYVRVASADKWRETLIMRRSLPLAAKPAARLICSISPAVNNCRAHPSACSQMSLSDRLYDVVLLLTSPPEMCVFPQVACHHVAAYHQGPLRETQPPRPQPPSLVPDQFSLEPSSGFHWSAVTRHPPRPPPFL